LDDIHVEVEPTIHLGYMMMQEDTRGYKRFHEYTGAHDDEI
jgi:hypothetical protein